MKRIVIGNDNIDSSEAIFGTWALGGGYWGQQEHSDSVKAIHAAIRGGVNHFDTAPVYGNGRSEQLLGQQLRKKRKDFIISSKCFYKEPALFKKSFEQSLKRLYTDYIDIFYIHWPKSNTDMRPIMEILENYRKDGRIRAIGVSNFSMDQMKQIMDAGRIDIMQCGYNLFWRKEEKILLPFCKKNHITTVAYSILAQGILTGKYREAPQREDNRFRRQLVLYDENIFPHILDEMENLDKIASFYKISSTEAAIFWTKENELIDCSIIGCRDRKQTEENLKPFGSIGNKKMLNELDDISRRILLLLPVEDNIFRHKT